MSPTKTDDKMTNRKLEVVDPVVDAQKRALAIANSFREKIGEPQIKGIIPGESGSSTNCILARTFNANCTVGYDSTPTGDYHEETGDEINKAEYGWAAFYDLSMAEAFRDAVNEHLEDGEEQAAVIERPDGARSHSVSLPVPIAQIAVDFDAKALDEEMYQEHYPLLGGMGQSIKTVLGL